MYYFKMHVEYLMIRSWQLVFTLFQTFTIYLYWVHFKTVISTILKYIIDYCQTQLSYSIAEY